MKRSTEGIKKDSPDGLTVARAHRSPAKVRNKVVLAMLPIEIEVRIAMFTEVRTKRAKLTYLTLQGP